MLPRGINYLLTYFDVCGFNSGLSKLSKSRGAIHRTNTIHIIMAVFFTLYKVRMMLSFSTVPFVKAINFTLQYSAALYTYWSIILDSNLKKREHRLFWQTVQRINASYFSQNSSTFTYYSLKFALCFITSVSGILIIILMGDLSKSEVVWMYIFLIKFCEARVFYYIFCVEVLQFQLRTIKSTYTCNGRNRFKWMREYYYSVYEMGCCLNETFGLSQVLAIFFCFYFFLADLNWIYINIQVVNDSVRHSTRIISKTTAQNIIVQWIYYEYVLASFIWVLHPPMLIYFLSESTTRCSLMVCFEKSYIFWRNSHRLWNIVFNICFCVFSRKEACFFISITLIWSIRILLYRRRY